MLNDQERRALLQGVAIYRLMTEADRYEAVKTALGRQVYRELQEEPEACDLCRGCGHRKDGDCELTYEGVITYDEGLDAVVECEDYKEKNTLMEEEQQR